MLGVAFAGGSVAAGEQEEPSVHPNPGGVHRRAPLRKYLRETLREATFVHSSSRFVESILPCILTVLNAMT